MSTVKDELEAMKKVTTALDPLDLTARERVLRWVAGVYQQRASIAFARPNDECLEVLVNGQVVATANHDEHGWDGMGAVEATALAVARALGVEPEEG